MVRSKGRKCHSLNKNMTRLCQRLGRLITSLAVVETGLLYRGENILKLTDFSLI